ncbi:MULTISPECIES: hypothetical protein [Lacticaseibacillus]|uniref:Uncharacterized protein n=2 Tax=Lacticaseibacillus TaxID=2759736 RepID=A0ABW4CGY8_9LACO|nr:MULTISPECIES: hypothetical protein [Lacticaseibacillus]
MKQNKAITSSPLSNIPTGPLLAIVFITVVFAAWLAWHFRENYDPKSLIKWYCWYAVPLLILALILHVQVVLVLATWLAGAGILAFRSNHYFYGR